MYTLLDKQLYKQLYIKADRYKNNKLSDTKCLYHFIYVKSHFNLNIYWILKIHIDHKKKKTLELPKIIIK